MSPVLALDFDGVLCDSIDECAASAFAALGEPNPPPEAVARFRRRRFLVRPAGEYLILAEWALGDAPDLTEDSFERARRARSAEVRAFEPRFFDARTRSRDAAPDAWLALHAPATPLDIIEALRARAPLWMVTTKDLASVRFFNARWDLGFDDDHLYPRERAASKAEAILALAAREGVPPSDVWFVDDHPSHLGDVAPTGARCLWARWGYHRHLAEAAGFETLDTLSRLLDLLDERSVG